MDEVKAALANFQAADIVTRVMVIIALALIALPKLFDLVANIVRNRGGVKEREDAARARDREIAALNVTHQAELEKLREEAKRAAEQRRDEMTLELVSMNSKQLDQGRLQSEILSKIADTGTQRTKKQEELNVEQIRQGKALDLIQSSVTGVSTLLKEEIVPAVEPLTDVPAKIQENARSLDNLAEIIKTLPEATQEKLKPDLVNLFKEVDEIKAHLISIGQKFDTFEEKIMRAISDAIPHGPAPEAIIAAQAAELAAQRAVLQAMTPPSTPDAAPKPPEAPRVADPPGAGAKA